MGQTITEKIFSEHVGKKVFAGEIVRSKIDMVIGNDITTPISIKAFEDGGFEKLANPPSKVEIEDLLTKLNISIFDLVRTGEEIYKDLKLENIKEEDKLIDAVLLNPILIQRPILVGENKAFIVRPPARIEDIINSFI